jgi:DNA-directed RNA polymerase sigma subunit (sigma70/sigma32)
MTDFAVKVTVRNARLLRAIKAAGFKSQAEFAKFIGTTPQRIGELLNFKLKPIANGDWSSLAMDISSALRIEPEELWPHHMRDLLTARNSIEAEIDAEQLAQIAAPSSLEVDKPLLAKLVAAITHPRRRAMIEARFGLNGEPEQTLEEIAKDYGVTRERIRQNELKAFREMREKARRMGIEVPKHPYRY